MADNQSTLKEIRQRWLGADVIVRGWAALPPDRRERVLADFEESARMASERDSQFASDLAAALDALDVAASVGSLDLVAHATNDIRTLLALLEDRSQGR